MLAQLGRYEEAIEAYRAALTVDPTQQKIRLNLGIALYKAARYADAVTELAAVRAAEPDNLQARYLEADCHLRMGAPKTVIELLAPIEPTARTTWRSPTCSAWPTCRRSRWRRAACWSTGS